MAKYVLLALLMLPMAELAAFIAVAATIGFGLALVLILAGSFAGALILRHAGGSHIARMRVAVGSGNFTALQADGLGACTILAGILLLIPGFITDAAAVLVLLSPLRRLVSAAVRRDNSRSAQDGVIDLEPEQWRRVPDPALSKRDPHSNENGDGR
jgi:UPF0716 protein FxsA